MEFPKSLKWRGQIFKMYKLSKFLSLKWIYNVNHLETNPTLFTNVNRDNSGIAIYSKSKTLRYYLSDVALNIYAQLLNRHLAVFESIQTHFQLWSQISFE